MECIFCVWFMPRRPWLIVWLAFASHIQQFVSSLLHHPCLASCYLLGWVSDVVVRSIPMSTLLHFLSLLVSSFEPSLWNLENVLTCLSSFLVFEHLSNRLMGMFSALYVAVIWLLFLYFFFNILKFSKVQHVTARLALFYSCLYLRFA